MEKKIPTLRDGSATQLLTRLLVPGDVVLLVGGTEVPADVEWFEGDVLEVTISVNSLCLIMNYEPSGGHSCSHRRGTASQGKASILLDYSSFMCDSLVSERSVR